MPQTVNLSKRYPGVNPAVVSVRAWLFLTPFSYPEPPTPVPTLQAEVPLAQAHFVLYEGFTGRNAGGTSVGRGAIGSRTRTVTEEYGRPDIEGLLEAAFPPPGPE